MSKTISGEALHQWRQWAIKFAKENNIDPYEVDWLLQGIAQVNSLSLTLGDYRKKPNIPVQVPLCKLTEKWQQRVQNNVPVQYLAGETPWRNFSLTVTPDVLIPRPETELIINIAEELVTANPVASELRVGHWADLGTGSGAIALGLAHTFPSASIHATDISPNALAVAQHNANKNHLSNRITFHQGDWLTPLSTHNVPFSGIVTNPPYIPSQTVLTLQPEVTKHEPHLALDGGSDGLHYIRALIKDSAKYLMSGGLWITELMDGQASTVATLLKQRGEYAHITVHADLSNIDRFVSARKAL